MDEDAIRAAAYGFKFVSPDEFRRARALGQHHNLSADFSKEPPKPPLIGTIYFIGPVDGPIKIGFASRLEFRVRDLRLMNALPLHVWASVQGPQKVEREYHLRFGGFRLHGEWFTRTPEIEAEIARLTAKDLAA
jgi:hypothetical protein